MSLVTAGRLTTVGAVRNAFAAEWTKIVTVRSTALTLVLTTAVSAGLAGLVGLSFNVNFDRLRGLAFDPLYPTFCGLTLGQLALVVFGVLAVCTEYSSGTVAPSLAAMPRRIVWYAAKLLAVALAALGCAVVTVLVTFGVGQVALGSHRTSLGARGVAEAAVGACVYLTLICLFAAGLAMLLRHAVAALAILLPLLFLGAQGLGNVPGLKVVTQYLPDQAGQVMLHLTGPASDPQFGRPYGAWTGLGIVALWTVASVLGGYLALRRRDS
jgi:ABC-2 type transport system permease protein